VQAVTVGGLRAQHHPVTGKHASEHTDHRSAKIDHEQAGASFPFVARR
jgi:hypothetical protein